MTAPDSQPVSWRTLVYGTPVLSSEETRVGTVREVLGSDEEDVFHGLRVRLASGDRDVMLAADDVSTLGDDAVRSSLGAHDIEALPPFDEEATYHLTSVGWLRRHMGWKRDDRSDEEPG